MYCVVRLILPAAVQLKQQRQLKRAAAHFTQDCRARGWARLRAASPAGRGAIDTQPHMPDQAAACSWVPEADSGEVVSQLVRRAMGALAPDATLPIRPRTVHAKSSRAQRRVLPYTEYLHRLLSCC